MGKCRSYRVNSGIGMKMESKSTDISVTRSPVKNKDLWETLLSLMNIHQVEFKRVRGHNGNPENERCDQLATIAKNNPTETDVGFEVERGFLV